MGGYVRSRRRSLCGVAEEAGLAHEAAEVGQLVEPVEETFLVGAGQVVVVHGSPRVVRFRLGRTGPASQSGRQAGGEGF